MAAPVGDDEIEDLLLASGKHRMLL
jgi:hypothetical protein